MSTYSVPKQNDVAVCQALHRVRSGIHGRKYVVRAVPEHGESVEVPEDFSPDLPALKFYFDLNRGAIKTFYLYDKSVDGLTLEYSRRPDKLTDAVTIRPEWEERSRQQNRQNESPHIFAALHAGVQREFKIDELTAALVGTEDSEWSRYREAQTAILHDLSAATKRLFEDSAREISRVRELEAQKGEELRQKLEAQAAANRERLNAEIAKQKEAIAADEEAHKKRVADFETREGRYVARKQNKEQLDQLKAWLADSSLTEKTVAKRAPVAWTYVVTLFVTGGASLWLLYTTTNFISDNPAALEKFTWWQWLSLSTKPLVALAAFTTFAAYYIRWQNAWARQHADQELNTRARVVDIGRASWLVESVRDAKEMKCDLPPELIRELSRNLFVDVRSQHDDGPQPAQELVLNKLTSLRVKTPDGEIEASSGKK